MKRSAFALVLVFALFASACRQEEPVVTDTTPSPTPSPSPSESPLDDFVLEGQVVDAWTAASAISDGEGPSPTPGAAATGSDNASPGPTGSPAEGTDQTGTSAPAVDHSGSGAVSVKLSSYFSDTGCRFDADDMVAVRLSGQTTVEPPELANEPDFPNNLENSRVTISGILLNPGANCLPVAESIKLLEGGGPTASPSPTSGTRTRPRTKAGGARATPSPTASPPARAGTSAQTGGSNTGNSSTTDPGSGSDNSENSNDDSIDPEVPVITDPNNNEENNNGNEEDNNGNEDETGASGASGNDGANPGED